MPIQTRFATSDDNVREQYAERKALGTCRSATFLATVKHYGLESNIVVQAPKGKVLTIDASDIWTARKKFLARFDLDQHSCRLTVSGDSLVELFCRWLSQEYSERYRYLISQEQQLWLKHVAMLVIARHLMETKYTLYLEGFESFADRWVCGVMCHLQLLRRFPAELARLTHHIMDDPEQKTALIEAFFTETDDRMIRHQFEKPEVLPELPGDTTLPFALLDAPDEEKEENDE